MANQQAFALFRQDFSQRAQRDKEHKGRSGVFVRYRVLKLDFIYS